MGGIVLRLVFVSALLMPSFTCCPDKCLCFPSNKTVICTGKDNQEKLHIIPMDLPKYTKFLYLDKNRFSRLRNTSFPRLPNIEHLSLRSCKISIIEREAFGNISNIKYMDLSKNKFYYVSGMAFKGLNVLRTLNLSSTSIDSTVDWLLQPLRSLTALDLGQNEIKMLDFGTGYNDLKMLKLLILSENNLTEIKNNAFRNLENSNITVLHIESANLNRISKNSFRSLRHLQILFLGYNPMTWSKGDFDVVMKSLCKAPIKKLYLQKLGLTNITGSLTCIRNLSVLDLKGNRITRLECDGFKFQHELLSVNLSSNGLVTVENGALNGLTNISTLNFNNNSLKVVPKFVDPLGTSYVPNIEELYLDKNLIGKTIKASSKAFTGLGNLKRLQMRLNALGYLDSAILCPLKSVQALRLSQNEIKTLAPDTFRNLTKIKTIGLNNNLIRFRPYTYFAGLTQLEDLFINFNYFLGFNRTNSGGIFEDLHNLKRLHMQHVRLKDIPDDMFEALHNLKDLILNENELNGWGPKSLRNLSNLEYLSITNCKISTLNESSLQPVLKTLKRIEAYSNPYDCTCDLRWYISWMKRMTSWTNTSTSIKHKPYKCLTPKAWLHRSIFSYNPTDEECLPRDKSWILILSTSGGTLVFVTILVVSIAYYNRWYIRYWMFLLRSRRKHVAGENLRIFYPYDCFITYSSHDTEFVVRSMLPILERDHELCICIHERNFEIGTDITENIAESIEKSRKIVVLLTENYVNSEWCKLEINMAHAKLLDERHSKQSLIIIMKEEVPMRMMTPILRHLVRKKTYIQWNDHDENAQAAFWRNLIKALKTHVVGEDDP